MESLAELMKRHEHAYRRVLPRDHYQLIRLDGKSFHSYTRGLEKPFDQPLMDAMDRTLLALCDQIPGVRLGYVESDEISLLITAFRPTGRSDGNPEGIQRGELWMGGIEAKILSLSAAMATATFNDVRRSQIDELGLTGRAAQTFHSSTALFDSRLWAFEGDPDGAELVRKYFLWRRRDSIKNSVTMAALDAYSHSAIHGMKTEEKIERLKLDGRAWEDLPMGFRFGRYASRVQRVEPVTYTHKKTGEVKTATATRNYWDIAPVEDFNSVFTEDALPRGV